MAGAEPDNSPSAILCFDFDGTLIDPDRAPFFNPVFLDYIGDLRSRGAIWVINTGRSLFQTLEGVNNYRITPPDYIIARECEIYQPGPYNRWKDFGDWNQNCARDHKKFFKACSKFFKEVRKFVEKETKAEFVSNKQEPAGVVATSDEEMNAICRFIDSHPGRKPMLGYQRNSIYLRFNHDGYTKGSALQELGNQLGVSSDFIFAGGDNHNDLSMLDRKIAGGIACPVNAVPEVKAHIQNQGGFVSSYTASNGMIEALLHYFYEYGEETGQPPA